MRKYLVLALAWWGVALTFVVVFAWAVIKSEAQNHIDDSIHRMKERQFIVIGYDPDLPHPGKWHYGSRGTIGEAGEAWLTVTYKTREEWQDALNRVRR